MKPNHALYHVSAAALALALVAAAVALLAWNSAWGVLHHYALLAFAAGIVLGVASLLLGLRASCAERAQDGPRETHAARRTPRKSER